MIPKIIYFGNGKDVIGGPMPHNINRFVLLELGILLGGSLTVKN